MFNTSPPERRAFVKEAAARLASVASLVLRPNSAHTLKELCEWLAIRSNEVGAHTLAGFARECARLSIWVSGEIPPSLYSQVDEIVRSSLAGIQSALFGMALAGNQDVRPEQFYQLSERIKKLVPPEFVVDSDEVKTPESGVDQESDLRDLISPKLQAEHLQNLEPKNTEIARAQELESRQKAEAEPVIGFGDADWNELALITAEHLDPSSRFNVSEPVSAEEKLLKSVAQLTRRAQQDGELRSLAFEVAEAAQSAHSVRFGEITQFIQTDTPDAKVELTHANTLRAQLLSWISEGVRNEAVTTLRQVGGVLWLELREHAGTHPAIQQQSESASSSASRIPGVFFTEDYFAPDGTHIRRARLSMLLPMFSAYEVCFAGRSFLIPECDVEVVHSALSPEDTKTCRSVLISHLLGLPDEWSPQTDSRTWIKASWRGKTMLVEAENVNGPKTYFAKNVRDAGTEFRGVAGIAQLEEGRRAGVIDLYPWFEGLEASTPETQESKAMGESQKGEQKKYVVFRVSGKRYAVPLTAVRGVGKLDSEALLLGMVETEHGAFHLRDIKDVLELDGESGGVYIAVESSGGVIAWAVDGVEKVYIAAPEAEALQSRLRLAPFGVATRAIRLILGVLPLISSGEGASTPGAPVYLINSDLLVPRRPLRRAA